MIMHEFFSTSPHHRTRSLCAGLLTCLAWMTLLGPSLAHAQEEPATGGKSLEEPIVVAPLDDNSSSEPVAIKLVDALRNNGKKTLSPPQVQNLLDRHKSSLNQVDTSRLSQDVEMLKEGAQLYFYEGPSAAKERIEKPLKRALSDLPALVARKDLAEQTYEAAMILLRAYHDEGLEDKAAAHALTIVTIFPSKQPSSKSTPPEIQQFLDRARATLAEEQTTLQIKPFKSQRLQQQSCRYFVNGFDASSADSYAVSSTQQYLLQMDCGRGANALAWKHTPTKGNQNAVPIIDVEPLQMTMQDSSFQSRTEVEQRILFVLHWTEIKTFIGVSKNGAMGTDQAALLVHVNASDRQALWSDGATQDSLCTTLEVWFPGLQVNCESGTKGARERRTWPLLLAGSGVVAGAVGGLLWMRNEREIDRIRCSPYADDNGESCTGVTDPYSPPELDHEDVPGLIRRAETRRGIGVGLVGGGALMLVGGLATYFLSGKESRRASGDSEVQFMLSPTTGGAHGAFQLRF